MEAEGLFSAALWAHESLADELEQVTRERRRRLCRREVDEGTVRELAADDGRALEQRTLLRFEQVEPALEQRLHRGWHFVEHRGAALVHVREELLCEERVARRDLDDALTSFGRQLVSSRERREHCDRLLLGQGLEHERSLRPRRAPVEQLGPRNADCEDRTAGPLRELLDEVEQRRRSPVDVLEHEQQRAFVGERLEEAADGPRALAGGRRTLGEPGQLEHALPDQFGILGRRKDGRQIEALDHVAKRQVRRALAVGDAAAGQHGRPPLHERDQLVGEARLADAGLADHGHDLRRRLAFRFLEGGQQPPKLILAADELRLQITGYGRCPGDELEQPEGRQRLLLARLDGLHVHGVADELERPGAEHDRAGRRRLLDPFGDSDRIARDEASVPRVADVHVAGVDPDPQVEPEAVFALDGLAQSRHGRASVGGGTDGAQGIVLVRDGYAEDGHDRVADELLDRAAVTLDRSPGCGEVAVEHAPQRLGVERLRELGRLDEVGEEDRDRLPPFLEHDRSCERRLEPRVLAQDRLLELAQLCPRLEPELLVERAPSLAVGLERVRLPARAVERKHELGARALVEGTLGDRRLQLGDELGVAAQLELGSTRSACADARSSSSLATSSPVKDS